MLDSRLYRAAELAANLLILNLFWLLASLPIVTIFPATAALFGVVRAWQQGEDPPIAASFIEQFKRHFVPSAILSGPWLALGAGIAIAFFLAGRPDVSGWWLFFAAACAALLPYLFASVYLFPVLVSFNLTVANVMRYALLLSIKEAPTTLLCLLVIASLAVLTLVLPILALGTGSVAAYAVSWLCQRTFPRQTEDPV